MTYVKCDSCGDESDSEPNLMCGRALGKNEEGDEIGDLPPYCAGTYRTPKGTTND